MQPRQARGEKASHAARWGSAQHLQLAVRAANVGFWDWDLQANRVYFSPEWKRQIGYEDDEIVLDFEAWRSRVHPEDLDDALANVQEFLDGRRADYNTEFRFRHRDGSYRWILAQGALVNDEHGKPQHFLGAHVDVTRQRQAEQTLRDSEELHRVTLANMSDTVVLADDAGKIVYACPNLAVIFGYSAEEVMARGGIEQLLGADWFQPAELNARGELENIEREVVTKDGRKRVVLVNVKRVTIRGATVLYTCRDVTRRKVVEEALHRSEERFRAIVEDQTEMIVRWRPDGTCTYVNEAYARASGTHPTQLVGTRIFAATPAGEADRRTATLTVDNPVASTLRETVSPTGKLLWEEWTDRGLFDARGALIEVQSTGRDITERRRAEIRIRQLNRIYAVLSNVNETIVREGDPPRLFHAACRIAVEKGGFRMAWVGLVNPADNTFSPVAYAGASPETIDVLREMFRDPRRACAFTTHAVQAGEHAVCNNIALDPLAVAWRELALERDYRAMASLPLKIDEQLIGTFNLYAAEAGFFDEQEMRLLDELALDIGFALKMNQRETERRQAEAARAESEDRFRQLTEAIQDVFWMSDSPATKILYVSPAYETIWGRSRDDLYTSPHSWLEFVHPDDRERVRQARTENPPGANDTYEMEFRIVRPDGQVRWIRDRVYPVSDDGGPVKRIVGVARDVTERRQLEEQVRQSQKMEAIGQLAGGVAHDFNNILAAILMQSEMAATHPSAPEEIRTALRQISIFAERAANLTRQLLLFSRRQVIQPRDLELNEMVTSLAKMLQRIIGEDVQLQLHLHPSPLYVRVDAGMLDQVILNLAVNARDAMPGGGRLLLETAARLVDEEFARLHAEASPGRYVWLSVSDTGGGIPPEVLPRIFEPFFTTKEPGKGTGLGLATVYGILKQHRGWIQVYSEVGRGTTFQVFLPAIAPPAADEAEAVRPKPRGGTETILIAEDEEAVRVLVRAVLERHGYRVFEASTGDDALRVWHENREQIALLLTDLVMPGELSGQALARRVQAENPNLKAIYLSGYSADLAGRELVLQAGENFLQKPFGPDQLLETVRRCLDT